MGKAPDVKEKAKPVGKAVTEGIDEGAESGLSDVYKTMEDGAVESANVFKKKFDESFGKLDMKTCLMIIRCSLRHLKLPKI